MAVTLRHKVTGGVTTISDELLPHDAEAQIAHLEQLGWQRVDGDAPDEGTVERNLEDLTRDELVAIADGLSIDPVLYPEDVDLIDAITAHPDYASDDKEI